MVVLSAKQSEEIASMPDHIIDNMRPNGRVRVSDSARVIMVLKRYRH
jgi:hypothetical protein